jgi:hypothetical protein
MTRLILKSIRRGLAALAILPVVVAVASCTSLLGDFNSGTTESIPDATSPDGAGGDGAIVNPGGKANGAACAANGECALGFCTDGVCCESACDGVCEQCNLPGSPGTCMPVPMNTDPAMECVAVPIVAQADAGTDAAPPMEAGAIVDAAIDAAADGAGGPADGGTDGGAIDGGALDAAAVVADGGQAGLGYNPPDGGIIQTPAACAGTCNGQRACSYPDQTKTCGTQFCNTAAQQAGLACDGAGHCTLGFSECKNYACENGACGSSCVGPADCLATSFCNGSGVCQPKKDNSVTCAGANECQSGFCIPTAVGNVCCNTDCTMVPGGDCGKAGSAGQCKCATDCGDGGACQLFYRDSDEDGYGDPSVSVVGCSGAPPAGYVTDNTDCDDNNKNAYPGQTAYFSTPRANNSYDYNCDGMEEGTNAVYQGASCGTCGGSGCTQTTACTSGSTAQSYLNCVGFGVCLACIETLQSGQIKTDLVPVEPIGPVEQLCRGGATAGFTGTANCGQQAAYTTCYTGCNGAVDYGYSYTQAFPCH